jgi:TPR repeat protein
VERDELAALTWLEKAAAAGVASAQCNLGLLLVKGVPRGRSSGRGKRPRAVMPGLKTSMGTCLNGPKASRLIGARP